MDHRKPKKDLSRISKRHMRRLCKADAEMIQDALLETSHHDVVTTSAINHKADTLHKEESTMRINIQELNTEENMKDTHTERSNTFTSSDEDAEGLNVTEFAINSYITKTNDMIDESFEANLTEWAILHQIQHHAMNALLSHCMRLGGNIVNTTAFEILRALLSNDLACQFSWHGRKGKNAFENLEICTVIQHVLWKKFPNHTEKNLVAPIKSWLAHAPERIRKPIH